DRDHRLVGEGIDKLNLFFCEWPHGTMEQHDHADRISFAQHGYREDSAMPRSLLRCGPCVCRISQDISNLDKPACQQGTPRDRTAIRLERMLFHVLLVCRSEPIACDVMVRAVFGEPDGSSVRAAKSRCRLDQRIEHRL